MVKRQHAVSVEAERAAKRIRPLTVDRLAQLSDELLLRIFSYLSLSDVNTCERISHKYQRIATDSQIWKALFYNRFVRPRASKIPGMRDTGFATGHLLYSSKLSKWLDDDGLVRKGKETNWKRQYKLRHRWSRGACDIDEIQVAETPPLPPLLVRMHEGIVYTADSTAGMKAWSSRKTRKLLAEAQLPTLSVPTTLAVDVDSRFENRHLLVIGCEDGSFTIYEYAVLEEAFSLKFTHPPSSNGMLSGVAICFPYMITMTAGQLLSLYKFSARGKKTWSSPRLLYSLRSHTTWPPLSLAIRSSSESIIATIAYAIPTYTSGWSVGVQEVWLSPEGELIESRLSTSLGPGRGASMPLPATTALNLVNSPLFNFSAAAPGYSKPTSLSYSHPYLLLSHADNTLTLYIVTSNDKTLSIGPGSRLWGHTSSVSGAHVGGRGKAVSVSTRGDELRIWELEGTARRKLANADLSVRVQSSATQSNLDNLSAAIARRSDGVGFAMDASSKLDELSVVRGWVGFDDENVVILRERNAGSQALVVYDFT